VGGKMKKIFTTGLIALFLKGMKKIFTAGLIALFLMGIIIFIFRAAVVDILPSFFGPLILFIFKAEYLIIPLSIAFTIAIIFLLGFLVTRIDFRKIIHRFLLKNGLRNKQGALYKDDFAAIMKEITYRKINGQTEKKYVIYRPFVPLPWSGFLSVAREEEVVPLKISFLELYSIIASFGKNTPDLLEELKIKSTD
jgi:uncharacterized membrane protein